MAMQLGKMTLTNNQIESESDTINKRSHNMSYTRHTQECNRLLISYRYPSYRK